MSDLMDTAPAAGASASSGHDSEAAASALPPASAGDKKVTGKRTADEISTPGRTSGRERKAVERLSMGSVKAPAAPVIAQGLGMRLADIPRVNFFVGETKKDDLKPLHQILFGRPGSGVEIKKNILRFSGLPISSDEHAKLKEALAKVKSASGSAGAAEADDDTDLELEGVLGKTLEKLQKRTVAELRLMKDVLDLHHTGGTKMELATAVLGFLANPQPSGVKSLPKGKGRTKSKSKSKSKGKDKGEGKDKRAGKTKGKGASKGGSAGAAGAKPAAGKADAGSESEPSSSDSDGDSDAASSGGEESASASEPEAASAKNMAAAPTAPTGPQPETKPAPEKKTPARAAAAAPKKVQRAAASDDESSAAATDSESESESESESGSEAERPKRPAKKAKAAPKTEKPAAVKFTGEVTDKPGKVARVQTGVSRKQTDAAAARGDQSDGGAQTGGAPSDVQLKTAVRLLLEDADMDKVTVKSVLEQLEAQFKCSLADRKASIKAMIFDALPSA